MSRLVMWNILTVDGSLEGGRNGIWTGTGSFWAMNLSAVRSDQHCCHAVGQEPQRLGNRATGKRSAAGRHEDNCRSGESPLPLEVY
jgi:hypothetical protein